MALKKYTPISMIDQERVDKMNCYGMSIEYALWLCESSN